VQRISYIHTHGTGSSRIRIPFCCFLWDLPLPSDVSDMSIMGDYLPSHHSNLAVEIHNVTHTV
jgi:hypothetical protein